MARLQAVHLGDRAAKFYLTRSESIVNNAFLMLE
jgi:hypothetical protein